MVNESLPCNFNLAPLGVLKIALNGMILLNNLILLFSQPHSLHRVDNIYVQVVTMYFLCALILCAARGLTYLLSPW